MASVALPGTLGIGGTGYEALPDRFYADAARGGAVNLGIRPAQATALRSPGPTTPRISRTARRAWPAFSARPV